ncbi:dual specificity protein phosphatase 1-like [Rosa sericea]
MDPIEDSLRKQISALLRVINVTKCCKEDNVPCKIEEGLFLGSIGAAHNKDELKKLNITHILTVAGSLAPAYPNEFVYKVLNVVDKESTDLKQHFDECFNYIEEGKRSGGVLVHCFVGKSRSVTIVLAYLMKKHGMSLSEALEHVRSRRPQASPNAGFMSQLQDFERSLHANEENKTN